MKKNPQILFFIFLVVITLALLALATRIVKEYGGGVHIPITENKEEIKNKQAGEEVEGVIVPEGFKLAFFAKDMPSARVIELDPKGRLVVSQTKEGKITSLFDQDGDGIAEERKVLLEGLKYPHGLAFKCEKGQVGCFLYVAESDKLSRFAYDSETGDISTSEVLAELPYSTFDNHFTRSLLFLPPPRDHILLVSVGSSCNVCHERDTHYAKILSYNLSSNTLTEYARGLRNAVFLARHPKEKLVFATEMGRDLLGDDIPPDEINLIEEGKNYGWPICYGKNIHDTNFDDNTYVRAPCTEPFETPSFIDLQAHSGPLGLGFTRENWPEEYENTMLVAYHGSWNRSEPTGYKIVQIKFNEKMEYISTNDFATGWLKENNKKIGRPVDIEILPGGVAYITDDLAGVVYKLYLESAND